MGWRFGECCCNADSGITNTDEEIGLLGIWAAGLHMECFGGGI